MLGTSPEFSKKRSGAYFTPDSVSETLVSWVCQNPSDRMIDPSCGDGAFLANHRNSVGIEQNPVSAHLAIERAPGALVHEGDFFTWAIETHERFECAAGNPPFIRYQTFKGEMRRRALDLCLDLGARFSGLTSSWAPFLVATAGLLKQGGRMAFVVPAEIGHAPYAAPLLEYLVASFARVQIVAVRKKLFPSLSEDCWLLYTEGFGGRSEAIELTVVDEFKSTKAPPKPTIRVNLDEWRSVWNRRLRPYLLPVSVRNLYADMLDDQQTRRLADFANVGIGYISGDNNFSTCGLRTRSGLVSPTGFCSQRFATGGPCQSGKSPEPPLRAGSAMTTPYCCFGSHAIRNCRHQSANTSTAAPDALRDKVTSAAIVRRGMQCQTCKSPTMSSATCLDVEPISFAMLPAFPVRTAFIRSGSGTKR